jgi:HEAT repeat protein
VRETFSRKAAIAAIGRLDPATFREALFKMLGDDSPGASRSAVLALKAVAHQLEVARIGLLLDDGRAYVRKNAIRLTAFQTKWNRLPLFLRACRDECEVNSKMAQAGLFTWHQRYNRDFSVPQPEQVSKAQLEAMWTREWLSEPAYMEIVDLLKSWTK